ncbi:hypothetical protein [Morganella morganii IS15]|nr:hypothetical protein [Morganella morganii IS15]
MLITYRSQADNRTEIRVGSHSRIFFLTENGFHSVQEGTLRVE